MIRFFIQSILFFLTLTLSLPHAGMLRAGFQPTALNTFPSAEKPLAVLEKGTEELLTKAAEHLNKQKWGKAAKALDEALRLTDVGKHAADEDRRERFKSAHEAVKKARHQMQNGNSNKAAHTLETAHKRIFQVELNKSESGPADPEKPVLLEDYQGALLINAHGKKLGEVVSFAGGNGRPGQATVAIGKWRDILGIFDINGTKIEVPFTQLVFGKKKTLGQTMVALPTFADLKEIKTERPR